MKIQDVSPSDLWQLLSSGALCLKLGPFVARVKSDVPSLARDISRTYADFELCLSSGFADFHVEIRRESGLRRWYKPRVSFLFDGRPSFVPLPEEQAFAMLEWGLNWCVAAHCHQYLIIHAAVIERQGKAAILPAPPGAGKSTLCAGLVNRGWRLLSDELALFDMDTGLIYGMCRPVNLKNVSIDIVRQYAPDAVLTNPVPDTTKGTVALMRPPSASVLRVDEPAEPAWIVVPEYVPDAEPALAQRNRSRTFMLLAEQSFNYDIQGVRGFRAVARLLDQCACHQLTYSRLDDAKAVFDFFAPGITND